MKLEDIADEKPGIPNRDALKYQIELIQNQMIATYEKLGKLGKAPPIQIVLAMSEDEQQHFISVKISNGPAFYLDNDEEGRKWAAQFNKLNNKKRDLLSAMAQDIQTRGTTNVMRVPKKEQT